MARPKPELPYELEINNQCVPQEREIKTPDMDRVCDAYYPYGNQPHGHHLQGADEDIQMSVWSWGDQGRVLRQEERNHDDTIGGNGKKR